MKNNLYRLKQSIISIEKVSLYTITLFSIIFFTVWNIGYALLVFQQFTWLEIVTVSLSFITIFILFTLYFTDLFKQKIEMSFKNIAYSFILCFLMWFLSISNLSDFTIGKFVHTYPLLETELVLGWDEDTVYHVSIIQSILHFGYPSIAQHGVPFNVYHALSHYIDALVLFISQIEPYDSYALLFTFKVWLFIVSITVFIISSTKKIHPLWYVFIFIVVAPILVGTWRAMSSHGLWFTTILILFSSLKIFQILVKDKVSHKDLFFIFIIIILISLGKISSGFMGAALTGLFLLIKYPKDKRIYAIGIVWSLFFIFYVALFSESYGVDATLTYDLSKFSIKYFYYSTWEYFSIWHIMMNTSFFILLLISYIFQNKNAYRLLFSAILSTVILVFIVQVKTDLTNVDKLYFYFGFNYLLTLMVFLFLMYEIQNNKMVIANKRVQNIFTVTVVATSLYASSYYLSIGLPATLYEIKNELRVVNTQAFKNINKKRDNVDKISIKKLLLHKVKSNSFMTSHRPLYTLREKIYTILKQNNISRKQALLFIPKEIYTHDISKFNGPKFARGMLLYAITGVPLIYGIQNNKQQGFNQNDYTKDATWKKRTLFSVEETCRKYPSKTIMQLVSFEDLTFTIHTCHPI